MKTKKIIIATLFAGFIFTFTVNAQLKVTSGGPVMIGSTTSSSYAVSPVMSHIVGSSLFSTQVSGTLVSAPYIVGNSNWSAITNPDYTWYGDLSTGLFHPAAWQIGFTIGGSEKARFGWDGCLLLGTATAGSGGTPLTSGPDGEKLHVEVDASHTTPSLETVNNTTSSNTYAHMFKVFSSTTKCMAVFNNGVEKYYVAGDGRAWSTQGFSTYSDRRLKENINPIKKALDKVLKLEGVTYNLKDETNKNHIGLIAQDVEKIVPEVVSTNDKGIKGVAYSNLIALLIEAIKEQNKTIEEQRKDIQDLKDNAQNVVQQMNSCCQTKTNSTGISNSNTSSTIPNVNSSSLLQNVPNPFSENTEISYTISSSGQKGILYVFDMQGTLLKSFDNLKPGNGKISINGGELKAGMYLYSLIVDGKEIDTKRMILTK